MVNVYPEYPSAVATVRPSNYMAALDALDALKGVRLLFCDGETFMFPETETHAIEMLYSRFDATIVLGQGKEYEFATKARNEGVPDKLLRLGNAVHDCTGQSADEMVKAALEQPSATLLAWTELYKSSMDYN